MKRVPNVLCITTKDTQLEDIDFLSNPTITISRLPLPNMKANKLYYVFVKDGSNRVFHIKSFELCNNTIRLNLGNASIIKNLPKLGGSKVYEYVPLSKFGLQEIEPGCLITIKDLEGVI